jgi:transposase
VTKKATEGARAAAVGAATRWAKRVERLKKSGLSIRAFAAREGLPSGSLSHWKWKLERQSGQALRPTRFVELKTSGPGLGGPAVPYEVVLASGRVVRVPRGFDAVELGRLVGVLEEARP